MADILPSAICDDIVTRLRAALTDPYVGVMYGPPENIPTELMCWVRYGPVEFEWGMFEVRKPAVRVTVAVPSNGDYPDAYALINDTAHKIAAALRGPILLADECPITDVRIEEPVRGTWAGTTGAIMTTDVSIGIETKEINNTGAAA